MTAENFAEYAGRGSALAMRAELGMRLD